MTTLKNRTPKALARLAGIALLAAPLIAGPMGHADAAGVTGLPITRYAIPTTGLNGSSSTPTDLVKGPDGAIWLTEANGNRIGRITATGHIAEYPLPSSDNSGPQNITVGPDGAFWFTENNSNRIGRITTAGQIAEYPIPTPFSNPQGITVRPDGNLWFVETYANKVRASRPAATSPSTQSPRPTAPPSTSCAGRTARCGSRSRTPTGLRLSSSSRPRRHGRPQRPRRALAAIVKRRPIVRVLSGCCQWRERVYWLDTGTCDEAGARARPDRRPNQILEGAAVMIAPLDLSPASRPRMAPSGRLSPWPAPSPWQRWPWRRWPCCRASRGRSSCRPSSLAVD